MRKQFIPEHQVFNPAKLDLSNLVGDLQSREVISSEVGIDRDSTEFQDWIKSRLGKITGSRFHHVDKLKLNRDGRKKGDWSKTATNYLYDIIGEILTGLPSQDFDSKATAWGIENEPLAIAAYELKTGYKVAKPDFTLLSDSSKIGCTPDGLIGLEGVIEIKCPYNTKNHIRNIIENDVPDEYFSQVLGHLLITGAQWCDFISFDPRAKQGYQLHIVTIHRKDFTYELEELQNNLLEFEQLLINTLKKMKK